MTVLAGIVAAFRMAQDEYGLLVGSERLEHIADIFKFHDIFGGSFAPIALTLFVNVVSVLIYNAALDLTYVLALAKTHRIFLDILSRTPLVRFLVADKAHARAVRVFVIRDKELAQAVVNMLHHPSGHAAAGLELVYLGPETAEVFLEIGHLAQIPACNVVPDSLIRAASIEHHQPVGKIRLRVVIVPVAVALDAFRNAVCILEHLAARSLALHHDGYGKQGGAVFVAVKERDVFGKAPIGRGGRLLLAAKIPATEPAGIAATGAAQINLERRENLLQGLRLHSTDRLVVAAVLHEFQHALGFHVGKHVHVHRIAIRHVDNRLQRHHVRGEPARQFVVEVPARLHAQVGRHEVHAIETEIARGIRNTGPVGLLGIGQALRAVEFDNLYRGSVAERALLGNAHDMRAGDTHRHRVKRRRCRAATAKVKSSAPRGRLPGRFLLGFFIAGRIQGQDTLVAPYLEQVHDRLGRVPLLVQAKIKHVFAFDIEGLALLVRRAGRQGIPVHHRSRVFNKRVRYRRYGFGLYRTGTPPVPATARIIPVRTPVSRMEIARVFSAGIRRIPAGQSINSGVLGCRVVGSATYQKNGEQYYGPCRLHNREQ